MTKKMNGNGCSKFISFLEQNNIPLEKITEYLALALTFL